VQLGLVEARAHKENKPTEGHFKKAGVPPTRVRREVRLKAGGDPLKAGDQVNVSIFSDGERVDVIGTSRGKGFQGVVKRHHFKGGRASHGSMFHKAPGSIGASSYPSRVVRGMRMGGHMGDAGVTIRNLKVLRVDAENNLLLVEGPVPGGPNSIVVIRKAVAAKVIKVPQIEPTKKKGKK
jgi:large subunit ribosomal protein L3